MTETKQKRKPRKYTDEFKQQLYVVFHMAEEAFLGRFVLRMEFFMDIG